MQRTRIRLAIFAFAFALFLATTRGTFLGNADHVFMFGVAENLARHGSWSVSETAQAVQPPVGGYQHLTGKDGRMYFPKGMSFSLLLVPFYAVGHATLWIVPSTDPLEHFRVTMLAASIAGPLVAAIEALLIFEIVLTLGFSIRIAALAAMTSILATILWPSARTNGAEPLHGALITASYLWLIWMSREPKPKWSGLLGGSLALLIMSQPVMVATVVLPASAYVAAVLWRTARVSTRGAVLAGLAYTAPLILGTAFLAWLNFIRYGGPLTTGYEFAAGDPGVPLYVGIYGNLFSAGKSIFLYSPPLILAALGARAFFKAVRSDRVIATFPIVLLVTFLIVYSGFSYWSGDGAWGPRYLIPITGSLAVMMAGWFTVTGHPGSQRVRAFGGAIVLCGVVIQVIGVTTATENYFALLIRAGVIEAPTDGERWKPVLFDPEFSPIAGRARLMASAVRSALLNKNSTWVLPGPGGQPTAVSLSDYDAADLWLISRARSRTAAIGLGLLGLLVIGYSAIRILRLARPVRSPPEPH